MFIYINKEIQQDICCNQRQRLNPNMSCEILFKQLYKLNFTFAKHNRKSGLIERQEIVIWRRNYHQQAKDSGYSDVTY